MAERTAVIVNASSGSGHTDAWADALRAKFDAQGMTVDVTLARDGGELLRAARAAVERGCALVVAGGGDGTVNAVASAVAGSASVLGVLPLGTLNHFAKDLGIPLDLDGAVATLAHGRRTRVDAGEVNGNLFLNNSSLGLYPDVVRGRERQQKRLGRGKWTAFASALLMALRRNPFLEVTIRTDGERRRFRSALVFIGNNAYRMTGLDLGSREGLDGGKLSLYVARDTGRLGLVRAALRALAGRLGREDVETAATEELVVETRRKRLRVATDGEVSMLDTPLRYRILPGALTVMAPAAD
jgi:YegS/Rv2252/BmrU family lipid kinase